MEEATAQPISQDGGATASPVAAQPEAEESGRERPNLVEQSRVINDVLRSAAVGAPATSKPADAAPVGESAPQGDVKPTEGATERGADGRFIPRRGVPEAIKTAEERVADLERQLAERDPATIRQQILDEQAQQAAGPSDDEQARRDAERYIALRDLPDTDPLLAEGDNWAWLQHQRELRANYPKAARALQAQLDAEAEAIRSEGTREQARFWDDVKAQMTAAGLKKGVDFETYRGLPHFSAMGEHLYDAGSASRQPEIDGLKAELDRALNDNHQLRLTGPRGLGAGRSPIEAGRSDAGYRAPTVNDNIRSVVNGRR